MAFKVHSAYIKIPQSISLVGFFNSKYYGLMLKKTVVNQRFYYFIVIFASQIEILFRLIDNEMLLSIFNYNVPKGG